MTIQFRTRKKINTVKVTVDTFRVAGVACLVCCSAALALGTGYLLRNGFSWIALFGTLMAAVACALTVALLVLYGQVESFNELYGSAEGGENE